MMALAGTWFFSHCVHVLADGVHAYAFMRMRHGVHAPASVRVRISTVALVDVIVINGTIDVVR